jgi:hypothetical protein
VYQIQESSRTCTCFDACHVKKEANMATHYGAKLDSPSNVVTVGLSVGELI